METLRIALLQLTSSDEVSDNIADTLAMIDRAVAGGAQFILTPETTHLMELNRTKALEKTYPEEDDPGLKAFRAAAKNHGIWLDAG